MPEKTLIANVRRADGAPGTLLVTSPVVGRVDGVPALGVFLNPFDVVLTVEILNERYTLRLPRDAQGRVTEVFVPRALTPVAYNAPLLRLDPQALATGAARALEPRGAPGTAQDAITAGVVVVTSPTEGIFYRGSSPDAPPYVDLATPVTRGSVLGLVEVMKCFNPITYGGPGDAGHGEIAKILVEDAAEVQFGQPLFWVRPLS